MGYIAMITIVNFSHPLSEAVVQHVQSFFKAAPEAIRVVAVPIALNNEAPYVNQITSLFNGLDHLFSPLPEQLVVRLPEDPAAAYLIGEFLAARYKRAVRLIRLDRIGALAEII